jgi:putative phage-type endonuclease
MSSIEVLPHNAPRELWLAERRKGIGGSDVSAIMGMSRWSSPRQVWLEKTGRAVEREPSWPMIKGTLLEPGLRQWYERVTGIKVELAGLQRNTGVPWMQYSPDGFIGHDTIFESKTAGWRTADDWADDQVADHAELQVHWGMAVTGRWKAQVTAAISDDDPIIRKVPEDLALQELIFDTCETFWCSFVMPDKEPSANWIDLSDLRERWTPEPKTVLVGDEILDQACINKAHASSVIKTHTEIEGTAKAQIMAAMKTADHLVIDGEIAATWKANVNGKRTLLVPTPRKAFKE